MIILIVILVSLTIIGLLFYSGEFRFEYKIEKHKENIPDINRSSLDRLSNTEINIFKQVSEGKTNQEIADTLFISVNTVKKHISNIFKKLNIKSRSETRKYRELIRNK